jgi:DNA repair protein RadC
MNIPIYQTKMVECGSLDMPCTRASDTAQAAMIGHKLIGDADREHLLVLLVDNQNYVRGIHTVAIGTESMLATNPSCFFRAAIVHGSMGVVMMHNHPSANVTASREDIVFYRKMRLASELLGVSLLDSIIVNRHGDYSRVPIED